MLHHYMFIIPAMVLGLPRTSFFKSLKNDFNPKNFSNMVNFSTMITSNQEGVTVSEEIVTRPYNYIDQLPTRGVRKMLCRTFNYWLAIPEEKLEIIGKALHMAHNTALLLDDIQDSSVLRRKVPTAHLVYGIPTTLNTVIYSFFRTLEEVLTLGNANAAKIYAKEIVDLYEGQGMEIYWRENLICPTEDEYKIMAIKKTSSLFRLEIELMELFSDKKYDFSRLMDILSVSYQICNDYQDLYHPNDIDDSCCTDISEGNYSFPLIHAIQKEPKNSKVMHMLRQKSKDLELKKYCVALLEDYGSFEYTRNVVKGLKIEALEEVEKLGGNPYFDNVLTDFFDCIMKK